MTTQTNFSSSIEKLKNLQKGIIRNSSRYFGKDVMNTIDGFPILKTNKVKNEDKENCSSTMNCAVNAPTKPKIKENESNSSIYPFPSILQCDIPFSNNPQYVYEYRVEIFTDLLLTMDINKPLPHSFTNTQLQITYKQRNILIDWIVDIQSHFKLKEETLFLCVNLLDRVFEKVSVNLKELQLLGITCLFIASKVEEIYPPELKDFAYITKKACNVDDILRKEREVFKLLDFDIMTVYSYTIFQRMHFISKSSMKAYHLGLFILETMFYDEGFLEFNEYIKALSALFISVEMGCKGYHLPKYLEVIYRTNKGEVKKCITLAIHVMNHLKANNLTAVINKNKKNGYNFEMNEKKDDKITEENSVNIN